MIVQVKWKGYEKSTFSTNISLGSISKTAQDTTIVTMEDEYELVCGLLDGAIFNDLERP